ISNLRNKLKIVFRNDLLEDYIIKINRLIDTIITEREKIKNNDVDTNELNSLIENLDKESLKIKNLLEDKVDNLNKSIDYN
ncbi:hypothetical protein RPO40_03630, partial [Mammaliicoccus fleurettii]|nr:hypothetical protein [Mammaliicoccus fleurettii]